MGKISVRPIFHGFIRSGPDAASMVMASKMMVMMALSMMPIMVMRTFPRRSGDDGPPPNGGDESTDWGAGDEGDDDDDPELPCGLFLDRAETMARRRTAAMSPPQRGRGRQLMLSCSLLGIVLALGMRRGETSQNCTQP